MRRHHAYRSRSCHGASLSVRLCALLIASVLAHRCVPGNHRHFALESETVKVLDVAELVAERLKKKMVILEVHQRFCGPSKR
jgi:hypothetical protein